MTSPTKTETVLLLGRPGFADNANRSIEVPGVRFLTGSSTDDARAAFAQGTIDHVVIGGIDLDAKVQLVRAILQGSSNTTVHLNSDASGPEGFPVFVRRLLRGLDAPKD
jgi:hypothetical protein